MFPKLQRIVFGNKSYIKLKTRNIHVQNIQQSKHARYLSLTLGRRLNMKTLTNLLTKKARGVRAELYTALNSKCPIPTQTKLRIYKIYLRSLILYGAGVRGSLTTVINWTKIKATQNIELRIQACALSDYKQESPKYLKHKHTRE